MVELPENWRQQATLLPGSHRIARETARRYRKCGRSIWVQDDGCPIQTDLAVVVEDPQGNIKHPDGNMNVFLVPEKGKTPMHEIDVRPNMCEN